MLTVRSTLPAPPLSHRPPHCLQIVLERELGLQPLLRVSGLRGSPMWAATLAVDCLAFFVTACVITVIGLFFHLPPFTFVSEAP